METLTLAVVVKKLLDFVRSLRAGNTSAVLTQLLAALVGVGVIVLIAHSDLNLNPIPGLSLATANLATQILVGLGVGIGGSGIVSDAVKAIDSTQTAAQPSLLTGEISTLVSSVLPAAVTKAPARKRSS